jgi:hypothetical protein
MLVCSCACLYVFDFCVFVFYLCLLTCVLMRQLGIHSCLACLLTRVLVSLLRLRAFAFRRSFPAGVGHQL